MKCLIARWRISGALNTGQPLADHVQQHLTQCAACRNFSRNSQRAETAMGSKHERVSQTPEHLHTRIMACVREAHQEAPTMGFAYDRLALFTGIGVVLFALSLGIRMWPNQQAEPQELAASSAISASVTDIDAYRRVAARAANDASVAVTLPMVDEMNNLKSDLASVSDYLLAYIN